MTSRQRKVLVAYLNRKIIEMPDGSYVIQGRKLRNGGRAPTHVVQPDVETGDLKCGCEGFQETFDCKHVGAVTKWRAEGEPKVGYDDLDDTKRPTYPQDGPRYRMARRILMRALPLATRALANSVFPVERSSAGKKGRPRIPIRDLIVCVALRTIYGRGGDLTQAFVDDFHASKLLYRRPHLYAAPPAVATITMNMRKERLAKAFRALIVASNGPYLAKKTRIGIDGSEFNTPTTTERGGETKKPRLVNITTVKLHAAVDVDTGFIVDCTVTPGKSGEAEQALILLEEARKTHFVVGFCADKGYVAEYLFTFCEKHNIEIAIPIKSNTSDEGDAVIARYARAWPNRSEESKAFYGRRGICESAFSRIKRLTDEDLRGRTLAAQIVELLSHVLVANVASLIASYVYGEIDLPWIDDRCKRILEPARNLVKDLPLADRTPKHRDGYQEPDAA
jgi:Transposase DDE domain